MSYLLNRYWVSFSLGCGALLDSHLDKSAKWGDVPKEIHIPQVAIWAISGALAPRFAIGAFYGVAMYTLFNKEKTRLEYEYIVSNRIK